MSTSDKILTAQAATNQIDHLLVSPLNQLLRSLAPGNGAGVFADPRGVRHAMRAAEVALRKAQEVYESTAWPTFEDYDAS
ncbi:MULTISPECIES: hypothetical protein [Rhodopseudomonas]|uniref:Uncharacterized protein n=1 Tax=Rhodopseudomonas palustris TaxID=1076 RepID=A0A0D7EEV8_RHOPL|nr:MULTISPECIES: hypothetical protein [Rhodopseudomonas]KIZ39065.1 hypothetical protein OO17_21650 [Rhodopseudomonas palustris]MDF3809294.1 hypothetical protein [Rhodopseudomonas sp. BAL398]WOK19023.1 hypothetical protein RBJ75_05755 [Rhodopseudomonas sp. BAL398]